MYTSLIQIWRKDTSVFYYLWDFWLWQPYQRWQGTFFKFFPCYSHRGQSKPFKHSCGLTSLLIVDPYSPVLRRLKVSSSRWAHFFVLGPPCMNWAPRGHPCCSEVKTAWCTQWRHFCQECLPFLLPLTAPHWLFHKRGSWTQQIPRKPYLAWFLFMIFHTEIAAKICGRAGSPPNPQCL